MAKAAPKGRKPKVYWAEIDGLNEWIVAAPNRNEALAAFGVNQDLFAQGAAGEEADPDKVEAARGRPCTPLRRPKGSKGAFAPAEGGTDWSAAIPKGAASAPKKKPDRKALERAEARLKEVEDEHRQAAAEIAEDRARLDEREEREVRRYGTAKSEAEAALDEAKTAFESAEGR